MIKADYIELIRNNQGLDLVSNQNNIFSDEILTD
jgi:hypothetical protein